MTIKNLSGKNYYYSFLAGAHKIFEHQQELNKINVFPVPDADTGTNLASTVQYVIDSEIPLTSFKDTAFAIADAAISGARGNSGIIFAQFLYGLSNGIENDDDISITKFSDIVKNAVKHTYEAITNPVEGTMLTVIREWAEFIELIKEKTDDFINLLSKAYQKAKLSLKNTEQKLEVLAKSHVVDAGAKGFVVFLEGMIDYLKDGKTSKISIQATLINEHNHDHHNNESISFRYCTEALINTRGIEKKVIKDAIADMGDSIVVAGSDTKTRIHIHTGQPALLFEKISHFGNITYQKVDDMLMQKSLMQNRKFPIAILTDSTCDIPTDIMDNYQIQMIPIHLIMGKNQYLDKLTITPEQFYDKLGLEGDVPTTSQPGINDFRNKYRYLSSLYKQIISIHLSSHLSGTYNNAVMAAREVMKESDAEIKVINSRSLSGGLGLIVYRIAKALEEGMCFDSIIKNLPVWIEKSKILVSPQDIRYFIRGGRVSPMKGKIAKLLNLKPIVSVNKEGKSILYDKAFSKKGSTRKVIKIIKDALKNNTLWAYSVIYSDKETRGFAEWYAQELEKELGKKAEFIYSISPVVGISAGKGTVAVSLMFE